MKFNPFTDISAVILDVLLALLPIMVIFIIAHFWFLKYSKQQLKKVFIGAAFTAIGLILFLQGVKFGYLPLARETGRVLGKLKHTWLIVPIGFVIGLSTTLADPAIYVLVKEVEATSGGTIKRKLMFIALCIGVGLAIALAMIKLLYKIQIYWIIIPGYIIAIIMTFFLEPEYAAMSFDSGGVVTGTMVASFILPLSTGVAESLGGDPLIDGFGIVGLVALMPILTVLTFGLLMQRKVRRLKKE
ncbi:MAG: DUF1538 domain-containing protein [Bacilli bacterium]|nr:DUF1538 domain-containing protein [Bacilli bacterium]